MDELTLLRQAWPEPAAPSHAAYAAARAALMYRIAIAGERAPKPVRPRRRGIRLGWLTGGTAVTATLAAAVAFAVAPGATVPAPSPNHTSSHSSTRLSGRQVLLAAATAAESSPAGAGRYWHLKLEVPSGSSGGMQTVEDWAAHDGRVYVWMQDRGGVMQATSGDGFQVGNAHLMFGQLQQLPTDPTALKAWIVDSFTHPTGRMTVKMDPPSDGEVAFDLSYLLYQVPAPPGVRAAAFRALASMPNVTDGGVADGGQALTISFPPPPADKFPNGQVPAGAGEVRLVIDPGTGRLLSTTSYLGTTKIIAAEWTNDMPTVISPSRG